MENFIGIKRFVNSRFEFKRKNIIVNFSLICVKDLRYHFFFKTKTQQYVFRVDYTTERVENKIDYTTKRVEKKMDYTTKRVEKRPIDAQYDCAPQNLVADIDASRPTT